MRDWLVEIRRWFHRHPELGCQEFQTSQRVAEVLRSLGLEVEVGWGGTGVVGVLEGGLPGKVRCVRADMDALPIEEVDRGHCYRSCHSGVMHACGHDVHMSVALGVAKFLFEHRDKVRGRVIFLFQPNEEGSPGDGLSGAEQVCSEGFIEHYGIESFYAFHCLPGMAVGKVGLRKGSLWSASGRFVVEVKGVCSHGAYPHQGRDALLGVCEMVSAIYTGVSREVDARCAHVVSVCELESGHQYNVVSGSGRFAGIIRAESRFMLEEIYSVVKRSCEGIGVARGLEVDCSLYFGADAVVNDALLVEEAWKSIDGWQKGVACDVDMQMASEDFSSFSSRVSGCYMMLGIGEGASSLHSDDFDVDEDCMEIGVGAMSAIFLS